MVKFLIKRPIAVIMSFVSFVALGIVVLKYIPVGLLPNIEVPEIVVQIDYKNATARELETSIIKPIRSELLQINHLSDINCKTQAGKSIIRLYFDFGANMQYAYIEANEKIDNAMAYLPKDLKRPRVVQANITDVPIVKLLVTYNNSHNDNGDADFLKMSRFIQQVLKRRLEQLPTVAMVDRSGIVYPQIKIIPDINKMHALNITLLDIETAITNNNLQLGNILVNDKQFTYNIQVDNELKTIKDIENIFLKVENRIIQIKDIAEVIKTKQKPKGLFYANNNQAVCLSLIQQAGVQLSELQIQVKEVIAYFEKEYPNINFTLVQDQSQLLEYSINNLKQSLYLGGFLAFIIMFFFLKNIRNSLLIGITIPVSVFISLLFMYLFNLTINIISLSGLILGVGMMIDNSIIVIENITQYTQKNNNQKAIVVGVNEVIRPLLSSVLTTCAVFLPLLLLSGLSGALFFDQAITVSIGLFVSFIVSITLLPVLFKLFNHNQTINQNLKDTKLQILSEKVMFLVLKYPIKTIVLFLLLLIAGYWGFYNINKEKLPQIKQKEFFIHVDWNQPVSFEQSYLQLTQITQSIQHYIKNEYKMIGNQQFLLNQEYELTYNEAQNYIELKNENTIDTAIANIKHLFKKNYPEATVSFSKPDNLFNKIFDNNDVPLSIKIYSNNSEQTPEFEPFNLWLNKFIDSTNIYIDLPSNHYYYGIKVDINKLFLYNIDYNDVIRKITTSLNEYEIGLLKSYDLFVPINLSDNQNDINKIIENELIYNTKNKPIALKNIVNVKRMQTYKTIHAGNDGEYIPLNIKNTDNISIDNLKTKLNSFFKTDISPYLYSLDGYLLETKKLFGEIAFIIIISILLLYFILAAQFESLLLPFIILLELPLSFSGTLLFLFFFNVSLNIMSAIGIVVMLGIIINDSIIKIDTINNYLKNGKQLKEAIKIGSNRRIRPILMTSISTILALLPFLFIGGLGADLQKSLAISIIGGMTIGTLVSLYFIPLVFYLFFYKKYK